MCPNFISNGSYRITSQKVQPHTKDKCCLICRKSLLEQHIGHLLFACSNGTIYHVKTSGQEMSIRVKVVKNKSVICRSVLKNVPTISFYYTCISLHGMCMVNIENNGIKYINCYTMICPPVKGLIFSHLYIYKIGSQLI